MSKLGFPDGGGQIIPPSPQWLLGLKKQNCFKEAGSNKYQYMGLKATRQFPSRALNPGVLVIAKEKVPEWFTRMIVHYLKFIEFTESSLLAHRGNFINNSRKNYSETYLKILNVRIYEDTYLIMIVREAFLLHVIAID